MFVALRQYSKVLCPNLLSLYFSIPDTSERDQDEISLYKVTKTHTGHSRRKWCLY